MAIPDMIAGFLFYIIGGVLADRRNPQYMMIIASLARILLAVLVGLVVMTDTFSLPFFWSTQFCLGIFSSVFYPSRAVVLKSVMEPAMLSRANGWLDTTFRTIRILAPMSIGFLMALFPPEMLFFTNAVCYAVSILCILLIRSLPFAVPREQETKVNLIAQYAADLANAWKELWNKRLLLYILLFSNMGFLAWQICWTVGFPVLGKQLGNGDAGMYGALVGWYGIGNLIGSLIMARVTVRNYLRVILFGWLIQGIGYLFMAFWVQQDTIVLFAAALAGIGGPLIGIPGLTAIQTLTEPQNTGKMFSLHMLMFTFFCIVSSLLGAVWPEEWSINWMLTAGGIFLVALTGWGYLAGRKEWKREISMPM